jgi:hypothetical protein
MRCSRCGRQPPPGIADQVSDAPNNILICPQCKTLEDVLNVIQGRGEVILAPCGKWPGCLNSAGKKDGECS